MGSTLATHVNYEDQRLDESIPGLIDCARKSVLRKRMSVTGFPARIQMRDSDWDLREKAQEEE